MMSKFEFDVLAAVTEAHLQDRLKEAEIARLVRQARAARPRLRDRVLASIGGLLISVGEKLQARYAPQLDFGHIL
jgi:hypothetical protein